MTTKTHAAGISKILVLREKKVHGGFNGGINNVKFINLGKT